MGRTFAVALQSPDRGQYSYLDMWYALQPIYRQALSVGGLSVHGAVVVHEGRAVLVSASGGTGKSTLARKTPPGWTAISDDEALLLPDPSGGYRIHPMPTWSDYLLDKARNTWDVQTGYPLAGVCFLKRSPVDSLEPLGQGQAAVLLDQSCSQVLQKRWHDESTALSVQRRRRVFDVAAEVSRRLHAFILNATLEARFWPALEDTLHCEAMR